MCTRGARQFSRHATRAPTGRRLAGIFVLMAARGADTLHGTSKAARTTMASTGHAGPAFAPVMETQDAAEESVSLLQVSKMFVGDEKQTQDEETPVEARERLSTMSNRSQSGTTGAEHEAELLMRRRVPLADIIKEEHSRVEQTDDGRHPEVLDLDQEPTEFKASGGIKTSPELPTSEASVQRVVEQLSESRVQPNDDGRLPEVLDFDHDQRMSLAGLSDKSSPDVSASEANAQMSETRVQQIDDGRLQAVSDLDQEPKESMAVLGVKVSSELPDSEAGAQSGAEHMSEGISLAEQMPEGDVVGLLQTSVVVHRRAGRRGGHGGRNAAKSVKT